jgi:hypothetical protein
METALNFGAHRLKCKTRAKSVLSSLLRFAIKLLRFPEKYPPIGSDMGRRPLLIVVIKLTPSPMLYSATQGNHFGNWPRR